MKTPARVISSFLLVLIVAILCSAFRQEKPEAKLSLPYKQAGLTERQAAAHLLSRFTYGAKSEDVEQVVKQGLEKWFLQQLEGGRSDKDLETMLEQFPDISLSNDQVENKYPRQAKLLRMAINDGAIHKDSVNKGDQKIYRKQLQDYRDLKGYGQEQELIRQ